MTNVVKHFFDGIIWILTNCFTLGRSHQDVTTVGRRLLNMEISNANRIILRRSIAVTNVERHLSDRIICLGTNLFTLAGDHTDVTNLVRILFDVIVWLLTYRVTLTKGHMDVTSVERQCVSGETKLMVKSCPSLTRRNIDVMNVEGHLSDGIICFGTKLTHSGEKSHRCDECGNAFHRQTNLVRHQLIHSGKKLLGFDDCEKTMHLRRDLPVRKKLVRSAKKSHLCDDSEKSFIRSDDMVSHSLVHSNEKPQRCGVCGKRFVGA